MQDPEVFTVAHTDETGNDDTDMAEKQQDPRPQQQGNQDGDPIPVDDELEDVNENAEDQHEEAKEQQDHGQQNQTEMNISDSKENQHQDNSKKPGPTK